MALSAELNQQLEEEEQALREEEEAYFRASRLASAQRKAQALAALPSESAPAMTSNEGRSGSLDEVTANFGSYPGDAQQLQPVDSSLDEIGLLAEALSEAAGQPPSSMPSTTAESSSAPAGSFSTAAENSSAVAESSSVTADSMAAEHSSEILELPIEEIEAQLL